ncbi:MAG: hypoxanthine phosphoribosyltransferase [Dehalococcoidia bacterium]|nr:hypoxanthine phosphoribosyltransferase [Dehalococcoidia bacterium]
MGPSNKLLILYTRRKINATVRRLAQEIARDYADKQPVLIGILKGSFVFLADLVRALDFPLEIDFIRAASYGKGTQSSGKVTLMRYNRTVLKGRHLLVIEDIVDSGLSVRCVMDYLQAKKPASVKLCCLLDKPERREVPVDIDYRGLTVPNKFLVGYGLDRAEQYRNLPDICYIEEL